MSYNPVKLDRVRDAIVSLAASSHQHEASFVPNLCSLLNDEILLIALLHSAGWWSTEEVIEKVKEALHG